MSDNNDNKQDGPETAEMILAKLYSILDNFIRDGKDNTIMRCAELVRGMVGRADIVGYRKGTMSGLEELSRTVAVGRTVEEFVNGPDFKSVWKKLSSYRFTSDSGRKVAEKVRNRLASSVVLINGKNRKYYDDCVLEAARGIEFDRKKEKEMREKKTEKQLAETLLARAKRVKDKKTDEEILDEMCERSEEDSPDDEEMYDDLLQRTKEVERLLSHLYAMVNSYMDHSWQRLLLACAEYLKFDGGYKFNTLEGAVRDAFFYRTIRAFKYFMEIVDETGKYEYHYADPDRAYQFAGESSPGLRSAYYKELLGKAKTILLEKASRIRSRREDLPKKRPPSKKKKRKK